MTSVRLERVSKSFDRTAAVDDVSLDIAAGELLFLLGPSGCGKSTLLRLVAGLHEPTSGKLFFGNRDVTALGTEKRNAVMCFQSYALWPHMTVYENVRFGLAVRSLPRNEQRRRVEEALALCRITEYASRKPNQLSGGQQQRVALARALAVRPDCLLLDEPLSNLDAKLRQEMRAEIRRICKDAGLTTIYVTHDQKEALSAADRIGVMRDGRLAQVGPPDELYYRPVSAFVADFIGRTNLIPGDVAGQDDGHWLIDTNFGRLRVQKAGEAREGSVFVSIRPEQMRLARGEATDGRNRITAQPTEMTFLGEASEHVLESAGGTLRFVSAPPLFHPPKELTVEFDPADAVVLPA